MDQMSFDFGQARAYMHEVFAFEQEREGLNERMNDARTVARELGVPTKAVEVAIRTARNHKKALKLVNQDEFDALLTVAREWVEMHEEAAALGEQGAQMFTPSGEGQAC